MFIKEAKSVDSIVQLILFTGEKKNKDVGVKISTKKYTSVEEFMASAEDLYNTLTQKDVSSYSGVLNMCACTLSLFFFVKKKFRYMICTYYGLQVY